MAEVRNLPPKKLTGLASEISSLLHMSVLPLVHGAVWLTEFKRRLSGNSEEAQVDEKWRVKIGLKEYRNVKKV